MIRKESTFKKASVLNTLPINWKNWIIAFGDQGNKRGIYKYFIKNLYKSETN